MKVDYLSYRVAAGRAVLGLVIQSALAGVLLIYAILAGDSSGVTAAIYGALGLVGWLALAIVFDQHRRERIEAMEAETLATAEGAGSVFESGGDEFRVARNRLSSMYKWFLPAVSIAVGVALVAIGFWRFFAARDLVSPDYFVPPRFRGMAIAVGLTVAVVGFIFARFISGMAKQPVWANLRGGAAFAVGTALMGLVIAVGAFVDFAGPDVLTRYLQAAFPVAMIVLGFEVFLNFVLDIYRPRKPGEVARPAFDSRILGFVAAPDRIADSISSAITYQLGFDVSSSWFYRLLSRSVGLLVLLGAGVLWGLTCFAVVQPHERALILRFGALVREVGPGLHFKAPWPIDRVEVPEFTRKNAKGRVEVVGRTATGVRTIDLATPQPAGDKKAILWTNEHATEEVYQLVQPSPTDVGRPAGEGVVGGSGRTSETDLALVSVEIPMQFAVSNVQAYDRLAPPEVRDELIKSVAQREIVRYFSKANVDEVLGGNNESVSRELRGRIEGALDRLNPDPVTGEPAGAGIEILFVGVTGVHPPTSAAGKFEQIVQAEQKRLAKIDQAQADAVNELTTVVGSVELAGKLVDEISALNGLRDRARRGGAESAGSVKDKELAIQALLESAGGSAAEMVAAARGERWSKHMGERGLAARYEGQLASYHAAPFLYRATQYFEALKGAMAGARVFITSDKVPDLRIEWDLKDQETATNVFNPDRKEGE